MDIQEQIAFLEELMELDQQFRFKINETVDEAEKAVRVQKMVEQDKENLKNFLDYLDKNGWPEISIHGEKAASTAFFILQHSTLELMEKYLPVLQEKAERNEARGHLAAMMEDRILMIKGQKQKFGSQASGDPSSQVYYIYPIEDVENVNARRHKAGFTQTVEEYAAWANFIFDPNRKT